MELKKYYKKNEEIAKKFLYADNYESPDLIKRKIYQERIIQITQIINEFLNKKSILLDIGCGDGQVTYEIAKKVGKITGIDISKIRLKRIESLKIKNFEGIFGDAQDLPFKDNLFDGALICSTLDHIPNPIQALQETERILKRGGFCFVELDNKYDHPKIRINEEPLDKYGHFNRIDVFKFKKMLRQTNLKLESIRGLGFPPKKYKNFILSDKYPYLLRIKFLNPILRLLGRSFPWAAYEFIAILSKSK